MLLLESCADVYQQFPELRMPQFRMPTLNIRIPTIKLPLPALEKVTNMAMNRVLGCRDWIIAVPRPENLSLGHRVVRWLKDIYHHIVFLFTGRLPPAESQWKQHVLRACTIAKRVAIVAIIGLSVSAMGKGIGLGIQEWGRSLMAQAAEKGWLDAAGHAMMAKGVLTLGSLVSSSANALQMTILVPVYYAPKLSIEAGSWAIDMATTIANFVSPWLKEGFSEVLTGAAWVGSTILKPALGHTAVAIGQVFTGTMQLVGQSIPEVAKLAGGTLSALFNGAVYTLSTFGVSTKTILQYTVVPLSVAGLKLVGFASALGANALQANA